MGLVLRSLLFSSHLSLTKCAALVNNQMRSIFGSEFIVNLVDADGLPFGSVSLFGIPIQSASAIGQLVLSVVISTVIFGYR